MDPEYNLFEKLPDHSVQWRCYVRGTQRAVEALQELGQQTVNECFATELSTNEIIARNQGPEILDNIDRDVN